MINYEVLTSTQKRKIAEIIGKCQECGTRCLPEPHRITRGYFNGKYVLRNLYWLCKKCHKERHANERLGKK